MIANATRWARPETERELPQVFQAETTALADAARSGAGGVSANR